MPNPLLYKNLTPLARVVNAAIVDTREDKGKVEQSFYHWGARGVRHLNSELFKSGTRRVFLKVNKNTHTATIPPDFEEEIFIGFLDSEGRKVPIAHNGSLTTNAAIDTLPCEDACPKCHSSVSPCNDLAINVDTTVVVIDGSNYEKTITKKMYPNGDYYLESSIPYKDTASGVVIYHTSKEFITHIDLKPCGCIEESSSNIAKIQACNPEVYCTYYAPYASASYNGEYDIFPEQSIIQLSPSFNRDYLYMEYRGFLLKINGQYQVPSVAFETLVEWIKYKYISGYRSVSRMDKNDQYSKYIIEKKNLEIVLTRTSISRIMNAVLRTPKFDIYVDKYSANNSCGVSSVAVSSPSVQVLPAVSNDPVVTTCVTPSIRMYVPLSFGVIVGLPSAPSDGSSVWQADFLKGALNLTHFFINDTTYTLASGDFVFDSVSGTINISPNKFNTGDVVVGNYFKI